MITPEQKANIRRLFHGEHWKIGTIATELGLHPDTVRAALESERFKRGAAPRAALTDPYRDFIRQTLAQHPRLRATRLYQMLRDRGYSGSVVQLRRVVAALRPAKQEAFLRLSTLPAEQAQADWASFGQVTIGRAQRRLSCFVLTLSYSRALYLEFFLDQTLENFLLGHVHAFAAWGGCPRAILYDNLKPSSSNAVVTPSTFIRVCSNCAATITSPPNLAGPFVAPRKDASSAPSNISVIPSLRRALSPTCRTSTARPGAGATLWPTSVLVPVLRPARWPNSSRWKERSSWHCRLMPSIVR
jgi:hypothetical protein